MPDRYGFLPPCMLVRGCPKTYTQPQGVQERESLDSARRCGDRDDYDREPAIRLDFIYRSHHSGYRLETLRYPMGLDAVYRLGNLGDAILRLDHRQVGSARTDDDRRRDVRSGLGRSGLRVLPDHAVRT